MLNVAFNPNTVIIDLASGKLTREGYSFFSTVAAALNEATTDFAIAGAIVTLPSYTVAAVPDATAGSGQLVYVSDEAGGAVPAFSDGTDWRRVTDRAVVS